MGHPGIHRLVAFVLAGLAATLGACGDDGPRETPVSTGPAIQSVPAGEAFRVTFHRDPGATWTGRLEAHADLRITHDGNVQRRQAGQWMTTRETHRSAEEGGHFAVDFTRLTLEPKPPQPLALGICNGTYRLGPDGRPRSSRVQVSGAHADTVGDTLIRSEFLCGALGSSAWTPDRPIRVGESWPVTNVLRKEDLRRILKVQDRPGVELPPVEYLGSIAVESLEDDGRTVNLRMEVSVVMAGAAKDGDNEGHMDVRWVVSGTARIDRATGMPHAVEAKGSLRVRTTGTQVVDLETLLTVKGTFEPAPR